MNNIDVVLSAEKELDYSDLEAIGIDTSTVDICRKLRNLSRLNRIVLDTSKVNKHLFDYFELHGVDALTVIRDYMVNLQPYMITKIEPLSCVLDGVYPISVRMQSEEVVVSFPNDCATEISNPRKIYTPVFANRINSRVSGTNQYGIDVSVQRGILNILMGLVGFKCKDVFVVRSRAIEDKFLVGCNDYIEELILSSYGISPDDSSVITVLEQLSFTCYGKDTFSTISLLIDSICAQTNELLSRTADVNLTTFVLNLKLTESQREDLMELLYAKYSVSSKRNIKALLERINDVLCLVGEGEGIDLERCWR